MNSLADRALLERLVAFPSVSGTSNLEMASWISDYTDGPGVSIWRDAAADGTRVNLVLKKGPAPTTFGAGLTLAAHLDVVPADEDGWRTPPFTLTETERGLCGRGTSDMKGFVALALNVLRELDGAVMKAPLAILLTYDEEVGTVGARELMERGGPPDGFPHATIVGEPTLLRAVRVHKGHVKYQLQVRGHSAHSAYPHLGHSAIVPAARAILAMESLSREMESETEPRGADFPDVPFQALNVGLVRGGTAVNVVPDACTVDIGVRTLPGVDMARLTERVRSAAESVLSGEDYSFVELGESPPLDTPTDSAWLRHVQDTLGGADAESVSFATDGGWLERMGLVCVVCGPGDISRAHRANEYITPDELAEGRSWLTALARERLLS